MKQFVLILTTTLLMASCATTLTPFTDDLRKENNWSKQQMAQIQFYVSTDVILQRKLKMEGEGSEIVSGKIRMVNGERMEEVLIPRGTPGVITFNPEDNRIGVSFEDGDDRYLMFGPDANRDDRYYVLASDWQNRIGKVNYEGKTWFMSTPSGNAYLLVDLKKVNQYQKQQRQAKGRTIN